MGYHWSGFDQIIGVDLKPQKNYPFDFIQADALSYLAIHGGDYDFIHASPSCQGYTILGNLALARGISLAKRYPEIIPDLRKVLEETGRPYVIENVPQCPLKNPFILCGVTFGLRVLRHRAFESSQFILAPTHSKHRIEAREDGALLQIYKSDGPFLTEAIDCIWDISHASKKRSPAPEAES